VLLTTPKAALLGRGRHVILAPSVQKRHLVLPPATLDDQADDLERLRRVLPDLELEVPLSVHRSLPSGLRSASFDVTAVVVGNRLVAVEPGDTSDESYGLVLDLGTTTVVGALLDLRSGAIAALASRLNRQERLGSDVISRISHAVERPHGLSELQDALLTTIEELSRELCEAAHTQSTRVYHAVVTGNATMLHLLLGIDAKHLSVTPFAPVFRATVDQPAHELGLSLHPEARVQTFPLVGAYVGADIVAGVLATGIGRESKVSLLIDIGTNGEIVLSAGERTLATAAPVGPAFEGASIRCGMRATPGAIEAVALGDAVELRVIGGGPARGICGSGLADAVAALLTCGLLDASGRLRRRVEAPGHPLAERLVEVDGAPAFRLAKGVELTQRDICELRYAKGAIAAGVQILMDDLGIGQEQIDEVLLAGSFGTYIDPLSARAIGLTARVDAERIVSAGNSSLEGAKMALLSFRERQVGFALAARIEYVEHSSRPDFNEAFVSSLEFPSPQAVA